MIQRKLTQTIKAATIAAFMLLTPFVSAAKGESVVVLNNVSMSAMPSVQKNVSEIPDFAFPETVEKNEWPAFEKSVAEKNGVDCLQASIRIIVARNLVSQFDFSKNVAMLDSVAQIMPVPYSSLFYLLEANLYQQFYDNDRWTFSQRNLPLEPYPEDPRSWSGDLFAKKILELVDKASSGIEPGYEVPIEEIASVITNSKEAELAGLSVGDFIVYNSVAVLRVFDAGNYKEIIPFTKDKGSLALTPAEKCMEKAKNLLENNFIHYEKSSKISPFVTSIIQRASVMPYDERREFLKEWAEKLIHKEVDARLLRAYYDSCNEWQFIESPQCVDLYKLMNDYLKEFPESKYAEIVKFDLAQISREYVSFTIPSDILPQTPAKCSGEMRNINAAYVLIYRIPDIKTGIDEYASKKFPSNSKKVASIPLNTSGVVPFSSKIEFEMPGLAAGCYVAVPSVAPELESNWREIVNPWSLSVFNVSNIAIITTSDRQVKDSGRIYVVDARTQKPLGGAEVICYSDNGKKVIKKGVTSSEGAFDVPSGYYNIVATKDGNMARQWAGVNFYDHKEETTPMANILTDLSIYRPGDKVQFAVVGWSRKGVEKNLLKSERIRIGLLDANGNEVDTITLSTDNQGRCDGILNIPKEGLLGSYELRASYDSYPGKYVGWRSIQVAEYKTPGFFVEIKADSAQNYIVGDVVRLKGYVKTYSGMPLAGSEVSFMVKWEPWWRHNFYGNVDASYGGTLSTDEKGEFVVELPTENLKGTRFAEGIYSLTATAVSPSGETQSSPDFRFSLGKGLSVSPSFPSQICVGQDSLKLNVPVYDMFGLPSVQNVECMIENVVTGENVYKGEFKSPSLILPADRLPSGRYKFTFNIVNDTVKTTTELVVYRSADKKPPFPTPLWVPDREIVASDDATDVEVSFGSAYTDSWILCIVSDTNGIVKREWRRVDDSNSVLKVIAPKGNERIWLTLSGMHDMKQSVQTVSVVPASSKKKLSVRASSFRDKISAGSKEEWRFTFSIDGENVPDVAAFAVMSDKALNALAPFEWNFNIASAILNNSVSMSMREIGNIQTSVNLSKIPRYVEPTDVIPGWNTYNYGLANTSRRIRGLRMTSKGVAQNAVTEQYADVMEEYSADGVFNAVAMPESYAAGMETSMTMKKEMAEEEVAMEPDAGEGRSINTMERMRPVEMPLAFFMPGLKGDAAGEVSVNFDTPDFNTTWQFQIAGYTNDLMTAGLVKDAVASKPVMVRSNPPRYLRTGDQAHIEALMFNNTDSLTALEGEILLFDIRSGEILARHKANVANIVPSGYGVISIEYDVPVDRAEIGMRVMARNDKFSDGEQSVIPILPSSAPIVESTQFYLGQGDGVASIKIPELKEDANVTLKYCDNPVWECVLALPSILVPDSKNVLSVVKSLYANSTAVNIVSKYPAVKDGIEHALAQVEAGDSMALESNLAKDADLKTVALNNTPWVNNAASETARMRGLGVLLHSNSSGKAMASLVNDLKGLQNPDGGWSWCPEMESSEFITEKIILYLGMMKREGCLPDDCMKMVEKGIVYCDRELYNNYVKSGRRFSTEGMLHYLYARSFFDAGEGGSGFRQLKKEAMQKISESWKKFSIYNKATASMLFARTKGYERNAGVVLESLNQFASKSAEKGWWFDNLSSGFDGMPKLLTTSRALEAYSEISPASEAVDGLRQWLVLQKETEDWGANPYTVEVIGAILSSGSDWTVASEPPVITLGGSVLALPERANIQGMVTLPLDPKAASGKELKVEKRSAGPVWGGVLSQYVAPIKDVKSESSANIRIEKRIYIVTDTPAGEAVTEGPVKVGDKIRVSLTLTCDKDANYVALIDERAACLEPADQLSGYSVNDGLGVYREVRDTRTSFFIDFLPKGVNVISYDCYADRSGVYSLGVASVQSQYAPLMTAHSAGQSITVTE